MFLWRLNARRVYYIPTEKPALYQYKSQELTMSRTETAIAPMYHRAGLVSRFTRALAAALARSRDRQRLGHLDPHLLRDIGLDTGTLAKECSKPFWRA
jgi:uncharacterized protein YjiS (DUF1127 family)